MTKLQYLEQRRQEMKATSQPSNMELMTAMRIAAFLNEHADYDRIRNRRTTWIGSEDMKVRKELAQFEQWLVS